MITGRSTAKALVCLILFLSMAGLSAAGTEVYLFGRMTLGRPIGDSTDYEPGVYDFPQSESYTIPGFGLGFRSGRRVYFGLEGHFNMKGKMTLADPSDNDRVEIDTYPSITGLLILGIRVINSRMFRVFLEGGVGASFATSLESRTYTSVLGIETRIELPEETSPFVYFGGAGIVINLSRTTGIFMNTRYRVTNADQKQTALVAGAGLNFSF